MDSENVTLCPSGRVPCQQPLVATASRLVGAHAVCDVDLRAQDKHPFVNGSSPRLLFGCLSQGGLSNRRRAALDAVGREHFDV